MFRSVTLVFVLLASAGCATQRPVLYSNDHLKRVGSSVAERDTNDCLRQVEKYVASNGRVDSAVNGAATGAVTGGTIDAAAGAAGGAIVGHAGTGAAIGGAAGGNQGLDPWLMGHAKSIAGLQELRQSMSPRQKLRSNWLAVNGAFANARRLIRRSSAVTNSCFVPDTCR